MYEIVLDWECGDALDRQVKQAVLEVVEATDRQLENHCCGVCGRRMKRSPQILGPPEE
jgi:hypothetical protein